MKEIRGDAKNVRSLLANTKYGIDYYQREYLWRHQQVDQLWGDLDLVFARSRRRHSGSRDVARYERYFLGSITVSESDGARFIVDGQLCLGTMRRSVKALDLLRDPRCVAHSTVSNRDGSEGEFKVYGRAVEVSGTEERHRFCEAVYAAIGYRPEEPDFHCFAIAIESAVFSQLRGEEFHRQVWKAEQGPGAPA